ncbi:MAG: hypothetical protein MI919_13115 [Holophagales bacterium]|nr:hypothetical protein [Holophagales bacterium]
MKLRIQGNSLRLRLKQGEVETFSREGRVESRMAAGPGHALIYALETATPGGEGVHAGGEGVEVALEPPTDGRNTQLRIRIAPELAHRWTSTDQVGLEAEVPTGDSTEPLMVKVEKDWQCLHRRPGEDESDNFPHPEAG